MAITFLGSVADGTTTHYVFFFLGVLLVFSPAHGEGSLMIGFCAEHEIIHERTQP
jgi:hypothetical protein